MDNYNNFFDGVNGGNRPDTPVYHTPDNGGNGDRKLTPVIILFIVIALIMCLTVIINVVVLAVLKDDIANKYAQSLSESIRSEYDQAILDYIKENGITEDILNSIKEDILNQSTTTAAEYAGKNTIKSVAEIKAVNTKSFTNVSGAISTGFLISDPTSTDDTRYLVTNAHSVLYVAPSRSMGVYDTITCTFPGDSTTYTLTPVYIGAYLATTETSGIMGGTTTVVRDPDYDYTSKPDLAVLCFKSSYPSVEAHPSLTIAASDYATYGTDVALVGYPDGLMVTSGCISQPSHTLTDWGYGNFYTTDAAINSGNSGGPMVNRNGTVIGVAESKLTTEIYENIGYAVSSATLVEFIAQAEKAENNTFGKDIHIPYNRVDVASSYSASSYADAA